MRRSGLMLGAVLMALASAPLPASAQSGPRTVEQRLQAVEDELAIRRVLVDYSATQDARDFAAYVALFAEDGEWVNGATVYAGRQAIMDMLVGLYGETPPDFENAESYHISSNPQIDLDGDRATARSRYLLMTRGPNGEPTPTLAGVYDDELVRENGEWKIQRRIDRPMIPTREEWLEFIRAQRAAQ